MLRAASALLTFGALIFAAGFSAPRLVARAADDCATIRSELFGSSPSDMQSAAYKYRNYRTALGNAQHRLRQDEESLDAARAAQSAYFVAHSKTDNLLEFRLSTAMNRAGEDRRNVAYFTEKLAAAAATLTRLNAEYKRLACGAAAGSTSENWAGTYVDSLGHKLEITGSGPSFTAESTWTASATQGATNTLHCTAQGSTATCAGSGKYFDPDKTIETTTKTTLTKSGSTIREKDEILTAPCEPKKEGVSDCKDLGYTSAVVPGAVFTITVRKE